ncbi:MAG TPA: DUF4878 domain-containing protein [Ferruginibacter sp.]|jgi:hypothetical protein|nr:hypothetical protein [Chitinophagaceae bacterium]HML59010.1 DUF4878 domain-containing protein [Ferruginibacter sp.]HRN91739.1 DUF4878 domain-containing protein [Ferruginibacter sp.]HRO06957.1 DUF4878 domain-containing protein [Ferruginibacter sp.]HRO95720.1 DUF4878 domain-containing protein [Ferruginibacter sp.]
MKRILTAVLLLSTVTLFSCKSGDADPKAVLGDFFDALSKKDMAKARTLATADSKSMLDMMEMGMNMAKDEPADPKFDKANLEMGEPKIEGDKATVAVKEKQSGESVNYILKKEDGKWKVAFDKASMMSMGAEKMGEGGADMDAAMDELKDMDADTLKAAINEGLNMVDSLKNAAQ